MNIYSIRDRLMDYFMRPFIAPGDKECMAAVANQINDNEGTHAIAKTPHHFEIWVLGKITEEGDIAAGKHLLCDCSSLVRPSVRGNQGSQSGEGTRQSASNGRTGPIGTPAAVTRAPPRTPPTEAQSAPESHDEVREGSGGVSSNRINGVTA